MAPIHERIAGDPLGGAFVVAVAVTAGYVLGQHLVGDDIDLLTGASIAMTALVVAYALRRAAPQK